LLQLLVVLLLCRLAKPVERLKQKLAAFQQRMVSMHNMAT
jgi:hypothetical protein